MAMRRPTKVTWHLLLASAIVASGGCERESPTITLKVPNGYRGYLWIVKDEVKGQAVEVVNHRALIVVPANGIARVRSLSVFEQWHRIEARDESGWHIGDDDAANGRSTGVFLMELTGGVDGKNEWQTLLIGTLDERDKYYKEQNAAAESTEESLRKQRLADEGKASGR